MATAWVEDRWLDGDGERTKDYGRGKRWRVRYRDPAKKLRSESYKRKTNAERRADELSAEILTGKFVDPQAGKITFKEYAEHWRSLQVHRTGTESQVGVVLDVRTYPQLGDRALSAIGPEDIQSWVKWLSTKAITLKDGSTKGYAPATVGVTHRIVSGIFKSAVATNRITSNPCARTRLPRKTPKRVKPMPTEALWALVDAFPERYRGLILFTACTGLRQGEVFGLTRDRIDLTERILHVDQQLYTAGQEPTFGPLKTEASYRDVPLSKVAIDALKEHLKEFPLGPDGLVFTNSEGGALRRSAFWERWHAAMKDARMSGLTFHDLRHYYASLLIRHGASVKAVQARLGHKNASETLDTYSHLWPDEDDQTRAAIDLVLSARPAKQPQPEEAPADETPQAA
ncbi:tyrosine-type recombinase/integrase [Myceligenerans indicum]|uniref:Site-specific integrase n=1 Tax=Myceligenerans indicum TaxID=2593663 RepID=A0ABS1LJ58_9MICO|nr:site-specific integrase [Myceligenerans indicum]MBL0886189.1 site-specific integrase [Myceligenerans indicum]